MAEYFSCQCLAVTWTYGYKSVGLFRESDLTEIWCNTGFVLISRSVASLLATLLIMKLLALKPARKNTALEFSSFQLSEHLLLRCPLQLRFKMRTGRQSRGVSSLVFLWLQSVIRTVRVDVPFKEEESVTATAAMVSALSEMGQTLTRVWVSSMQKCFRLLSFVWCKLIFPTYHKNERLPVCESTEGSVSDWCCALQGKRVGVVKLC